MKRIVMALVLVVVGLLCLGFYMKWFSVSSDSGDGKGHMTFTVDKDRIHADEERALDKAKSLGKQAKDKVAGSGELNMDGTVVGVSGDQLTMTDKEGKEHRHALATDVKVTCDGKTCLAGDLKAGMRIRVTSAKAEPHGATQVEALDKNRDFEKGI